MAESQSRFSIIEELTRQKADAEDKINQLTAATENDVLELKRWEKAVVDERESRNDDLTKNKTQRERQITSLDQRKEELEKAITAIQRISVEKAQ